MKLHIRLLNRSYMLSAWAGQSALPHDHIAEITADQAAAIAADPENGITLAPGLSLPDAAPARIQVRMPAKPGTGRNAWSLEAGGVRMAMIDDGRVRLLQAVAPQLFEGERLDWSLRKLDVAREEMLDRITKLRQMMKDLEPKAEMSSEAAEAWRHRLESLMEGMQEAHLHLFEVKERMVKGIAAVIPERAPLLA